ncbi:MAG TPA: hypothetical protein VFQ87_03285 [Bradyrhizobium sp.]|jgi:hypothetical protein|nr:hypothetical protein [Bradyrhizobium sp.]
MTPPKTRAIQYIPPGQRPRPRQRAIAVSTYRLTLTRETTGEVLHEWGGIPHDRVMPLLETMRRYLPFLAKAAAFREAWSKLAALFQ